jgi:hypothetical protein
VQDQQVVGGLGRGQPDGRSHATGESAVLVEADHPLLAEGLDEELPSGVARAVVDRDDAEAPVRLGGERPQALAQPA